jgi:hypothetical protein
MSHHAHFEHSPWQLPVLLTLTLLLAASLYLRGWIHLRSASASAIPAWRADSFFLGLFFVWTAAGSPLAAYDHNLLTAHMIKHLFLMTFAPALILMGEPLRAPEIHVPVIGMYCRQTGSDRSNGLVLALFLDCLSPGIGGKRPWSKFPDGDLLDIERLEPGNEAPAVLSNRPKPIRVRFVQAIDDRTGAVQSTASLLEFRSGGPEIEKTDEGDAWRESCNLPFGRC